MEKATQCEITQFVWFARYIKIYKRSQVTVSWTRSENGGVRAAYRVLTGFLQGLRPVGRPRRRWSVNV